MNFVLGPVPPESNPPIEPQFYIPSRFNISAITNGQTTTITTSINHDYVVGQLIRLTIPPICLAYGLNEERGLVISIPAANQVVVDIFSGNASAFTAAPATGTQPQIMALGDLNSGQINAFGRVRQKTFIPGSFINISPA